MRFLGCFSHFFYEVIVKLRSWRVGESYSDEAKLVTVKLSLSWCQILPPHRCFIVIFEHEYVAG